MIKNNILSLFKKNFKYSPTKNQEKLIEELANLIISFKSQDKDKKIFLLKGYAGTGKTTIISSFVKILNSLRIKTILLAPTGRAAKVLSFYAGKNAFTIHKKIYKQKSSKDGFGKFVLNKNLHSYTFFIVDESSMISNSSNEATMFGSGRLLDDLIEYVYNDKNCMLIVVGDTAQLPPVGIDTSPALQPDVLEGYNLTVNEIELTEVIRQSFNSGILYNATKVREQINEMPIDFYYPKIKLHGFNDIYKISGEDLIEEISSSYDKYGIEQTIVVSRSNKRANKYNQGIRNTILYREEEISIGDYLMIVKNNYHWLDDNDKIDFIANGDIVEIIRIKNYQEKYGFRFADVSIRFIDYDIEIDTKIMLSTLSIETASLNNDQNKQLYYSVLEDYSDIKSKKQQYELVKKDPFFNALQVKFSYAITCHKSQGGQWKAVFVDQGYLNNDMLNVEYLRWLYTAITRSTEKLYLVNFKKDFFEEDC
ncbi:MAG: ATP-dependent endonuclease [Bacteroidetes bacterium]|nr:MAG: ATP-dependent endonuclease [Bacteroidota bacterium]